MSGRKGRAFEVILLLLAAPLCVGLTCFWSGVRVGSLYLSYFVCDLLWSAVLFWAAARIGGLFATGLAALTLVTAYVSGYLTSVPLLLSLLLAGATFTLMTTRMKGEDVRIRIAAPLFCKFMVAWLVALQIALPMGGETETFLKAADYMLGAPHVVSTLLGCGAAALLYGKAEGLPLFEKKKAN